jgi:hypothetical protein
VPIQSFDSYCDRYQGRTGWVVGRGPTSYRYEDLARADGPVFFVNDAVGQEKWLGPGQDSFFFAHDASMRCWLKPGLLRSVPVLIADQPETGPVGQRMEGLILSAGDRQLEGLTRVVLYRKSGPLDRETLLDRTRPEIARAGQLHTWSGTIHPLLHFAWYVGCSRLNLVGCDGLPEAGYDTRLENRSGSRQLRSLNIRVTQDAMLRRLSLPWEHLGTIPHHIAVLFTLRQARANRGWFLPWLEEFRAVFRSSGCGELVLADESESSDRCLVTGIVPRIDPLASCMDSEAFKKAIQRVGQLDPKGSLHAAFKTVLAKA